MLLEASARGLLKEVSAIIVAANAQFDRIKRPPNVPVFQKPLDLDLFAGAVKELLA